MNAAVKATFKAHSPKLVKKGQILQKILEVFRLVQLVWNHFPADRVLWQDEDIGLLLSCGENWVLVF
jgi:hypothetical protein